MTVIKGFGFTPSLLYLPLYSIGDIPVIFLNTITKANFENFIKKWYEHFPK